MIDYLWIFCIFVFTLSPINGRAPPKKYEKHMTLKFGPDQKVDEYLGIPFAQPPTGAKRFKEPVEYVKKTKDLIPFKANTPARTCPQDLFQTGIHALDFWNPPKGTISEDCLQLNMWVPKNTTGAVLVNLCGGAYWRLGASNDIFNGSVLAAYSRAIVVNLNFRLGALGFARFKKGKDGVTGNMGLLDQQMGLKWIQKNIKEFGGDPTKVTLMGEQTGASSAEAHLYSRKSRGLFSRIALTSGVLENPWALRSKSYVEKATEKLAKKLGCTNEKTQLKCLQGKNYKKILDVFAEIKNESFSFGYPFSLIPNDGSFFKEDFTKEKAQIINNVDVLMGDTRHEGSFFLYYYFGKKYDCRINWNRYPPVDKCNIGKMEYENLIMKVQKLFGKDKAWGQKVFDNCKNPKDCKDEAFKFLSEVLFDCGLKHFADKLTTDKSQNNPFVYILKHRSVEKKTSWPETFGTVHAALIEFLFGRPFRYPENYEVTDLKAEQRLSQSIMELYGKFADTGKTKKGWERYKKNNQKILILNSKFVKDEEFEYQDEKRLDRCSWLIKPFELEMIGEKKETTEKPSKKSDSKKSSKKSKNKKA